MILNPHTSQTDIQHAIALLHQGELVGMPTETVYGLAGDARNARAIATIYHKKGRPTFNPLIIHTHSLENAQDFVIFSAKAHTLATHFWPGPLTLVLPRKEKCSVDLLASAGLPTLAIRIPSHPLALALLQAFGHPLAAPSANLSNSISPTTKVMVEKDFPDLFVMEGGASHVGLESTIMGFDDQDRPLLYRAGGIAVEDIEKILRENVLPYQATTIHAPGMLKKHYAPRHKLRINALTREPGEVILGFGTSTPLSQNADLNLSIRGDLVEAAAHLFQMLHSLDERECAGIAVAPIPMHGLGRAINDRLERASA